MSLAEVAGNLAEYLREVGFVRLHKYLLSRRYHVRPNLRAVESTAVAAAGGCGEGDLTDLALALCLMVDAPLDAAAVTPARQPLVAALLEAGLLHRAGDALRLAGVQLSSFHGAPLFIDRRLGLGDATHEVYVGADTTLLTAHLDTERIGRDDPVLDLGTGSGAMALYLARFSDRVVATDVMPAPLWLAELNVHLNQRDRTVELRPESYVDTLARGDRYQAVVFNPPYLPVPEGLSAPAYGGGPGHDGLDHCRMLVELFDVVVAPGGVAYLVAALAGDDRGPYFFTELARYAAALDLAVDVFIDGCADLRTDPEPLAQYARHLARRNPGLPFEQALARVAQLYRVELRADCLYLASMVLRRARAGRAALFRR